MKLLGDLTWRRQQGGTKTPKKPKAQKPTAPQEEKRLDDAEALQRLQAERQKKGRRATILGIDQEENSLGNQSILSGS